MANEFKIKTGLLLGPSPTQPVIGIRDTSSSIISDASSILVTGKAIYDYVYSETQPLILDISVLDYRLDITDSSVSTLTLRLNTTDSSLNTLLGRHNITESSLGLLTNQVNIIDSSLNIVTLRLNITDSSLNILLNRHNITESSLGALTIRVTNAEASINSIDASTKFWKVYVDGSLAFRDTSISYLSTISSNHDSSISLLNNWNVSQDASIVRIDVSLNNTTDALSLFYEKGYIDGSFGSRDTSINTLYISLNTTDSSLNTLLGRHNVTESSLGLLTIRVTDAETSINKIDASTKYWLQYVDGSLNVRDTSISNINSRLTLVESSVGTLTIRLNTTDSSLNTLLGRHNVTESSVGLLTIRVTDAETSINWLNVEKVNRSGDSMYGALDMSVNSINQILNLQFNTDPSVSYAEGKVSWNKNEHTININTGIDDVTIQAGLETLVSVWNDTGETIPNMTPVISNGSYNGYTTVIKAQANNRSINNLVGITTHDIEPSTMGFAAKSGKIRDGNTSMWNNGDLLYVSGDVSGGLTNIRPLPVKYPVNIARVEKSDASYGVIVMCNLTLEQNAARINAGGIQIGSFTDNSDGSVTIGAGLYNLFDASDFNGPLYTYEIDTCTFTLIDNSSNYIVADYNEGNPIYKLINNVEPINESTIVPAYTLFRDASYVTQIDWDDMALGLPNKLHQRFVKTARFAREQGLEITEEATRIIQVNGGIVWYGARRLTLDTVRSDTDSMQRWVKTGGVWGKTIVTQYENLYYQNGADVALIGNNNYGVVWIYRESGDFPLIRFVLGTSSYNKLSEAQSAGIPADLPSVIRTNSILISRIIIKSGASTSSEIKWAFTDLFTLEQSIPDHNDTLNKQGGLPNEYYHLSSAQYTDYVGKTYVDGSLSTRDTSISNLNLRLGIAETSIGTLTTRLNTTDSSLNTLLGRHNITESSLGILTSRYNFTEVSLGTLTTRVNNHDTSILLLNNWNISQDASIIIQKQYWIDINRMGFTNQTDSSISFDPSTYVFSLTKTGSSWTYFRSGIEYNITRDVSVQFPGTPPTTGIYYIYIDDNLGNLTVSNTVWTLMDEKIPVSVVIYNSVNSPSYHLAEERHSCLIDRRDHLYNHITRGTQLFSGGTLSGPTLNSATNYGVTFGVSQTVIADEDIIETLPVLIRPDGSTLAYSIFYRTDASTWTWRDSSVPYLYTSGGYINWDNNGTLIEGAASKYYNYYLLFTNIEGRGRYGLFPGRGEFSSIANAQAESVLDFSFLGFPIVESVIAYQITFATRNAYTNLGKCRVESTPRPIRVATVTTVGSGASTDHNTLAGLQGGTSLEYYHLTSTQYADWVGKTYVDGSFGLRDTSIGNLNSRLTLVESSIGSLTVRLNTTDSSLNTLLGRHNITESSLGSLTTRLNTTDTSLSTLLGRHNITESSLGSLTTLVSNHDTSILLLNNWNISQDVSISNLRIAINSSLGTYLRNTTDTFIGVLTIDGSIHINGDIYQDGSSYITHAENVYTTKDFITLRDGALTGLSDGSISGLRIMIPNGSDNLILGTDNDAILRIGWEGDTLQAIATRENTPTNGYYAYWDDGSVMFKTFNLKGYIDTSTSNLNTRLGLVETSIGSLTTRLNTTDSSLNVLLGRHNITESSLGTLTTRVTNAEASINRLDASTKFWKIYVDGSFGSRDTSIGNLNTRLGLVETSVGTLTTRLNTTDSSLNTLLGKHNTTESSVGTLTTRLNTTDSSLLNVKATYIPDVSLNQSKFKWVTGYLEPSVATGSSLTIGSRYQIPYSNSSGTDFDYSNNFSWNNKFLTIYDSSFNLFIGLNTGGVTGTGASGHNLAIGTQSAYYLISGSYNTYTGNFSGFGNISGHRNTYLGYATGFNSSTGDNNLYLGYYSGYNQTGSNKLIIDTINRASESIEQTDGLIYGEFNVDSSSQLLRINGLFELPRIIESVKSKVLYYDTASKKISYGDPSTGSSSASQWTTSGTTIYYANPVLIGRTGAATSGYELDVQGESVFSIGEMPNQFDIYDAPNGTNVLSIDGENRFILFDTGSGGYKIGINDTTPDYTLDLNGELNVDGSIFQRGVELAIRNYTLKTYVDGSLSTRDTTISGLTTRINNLDGSVANYNTAYTHSQNNSQAHSDYLINNGDDTTSGTITAAGFTTTGTASMGTFINTTDYFQKIFQKAITFPNGVANQAVNIEFTNGKHWGYIEVEITSDYDGQNSVGKLTKLFAVGTVANNNIYTNESRVVDTLGTISDNISIGEFQWSAGVSKYIIPISHIVSTANTYTLKLRAFSTNGNAANTLAATLSSVYTLTALPRNYVHYNTNVGIGTATPKKKLEVAGDIMAGTNNAIGWRYDAGDDNYYSYLTANGASYLNIVGGLFTTDGATEAIRLTSSSGTVSMLNNGNLGIGTTSPDEKLSLSNISSGVNLARISFVGQTGDGNNTANGGIRFKNDNAVYYSEITGYRGGDSTQTALVFSTTNNSAVTPRMFIQWDGNVGINTTAPASKLDVYAGNIRITNPAPAAGTFGQYEWYQTIGSAGVVAAIEAYRAPSDYQQTSILFKTSNGSSLVERMRIHYDGNVGIGTTAPDYLLDSRTSNVGGLNTFRIGNSDNTNAASGARSIVQVGGSSAGNPRFIASIYGVQEWSMGILNNDSDKFVISTDSDLSSPKMTFLTNGNVGIGTTSPTTKLHVEDTGQLTVYFNGNTSAGSFSYGTALNLKTNINARGRGIFYTTSDSAAEWFSGIPYQGAGYVIGYNGTGGQSEYILNTKMIVTGTGNVGIGTATANYRLDVSGGTMNVHSSSATAGYISTGNYGGTGNAARFPSGIYSDGPNWLYGGLFVDANGIKPNINNTSSLGNASYQFGDLFLGEGGVINWDNGDITMTQVGNVLNIVGGDVSIGSAIIASGNIRSNGYVFANQYVASTTGTVVVGTASSGSVILRPTSYGSSTAQSSFGTTAATIGTNTTVSGTVTASNFILSSDISVKENIKPIKDKHIDDINIISFNFIDDKTKRQRYGVIAQELEKTYPEMVYENEEGIKQVGYIDFLLVKMNEKDKKINELEKRLEKLEKLIK